MLPISPNLCLALFGVGLVLTYMSVRLGWVRPPNAAVVGVMVNAFFVFLYSLTRGNGLTQALVVSLTLGTFFTVIGVLMASLFRSHVPQPATEEVPTAQVVEAAVKA
jgi:uncharacterized membrane protein YfcA